MKKIKLQESLHLGEIVKNSESSFAICKITDYQKFREGIEKEGYRGFKEINIEDRFIQRIIDRAIYEFRTSYSIELLKKACGFFKIMGELNLELYMKEEYPIIITSKDRAVAVLIAPKCKVE